MRWVYKGQKLEVESENSILKPFILEVFRLYFHSCNRCKFIDNITKLSQDLISSFYDNTNGHKDAYFTKPNNPKNRIEIDFKLDDNKHVLFFTGGKDSIYQLHDLIRKNKPENILCLYVENINKSECFYEKKAVKEICESLGVEYKILKLTNSVKINRQNHNIGLREQLIFAISLSSILDFKAKNIHYGFHQEGFRDCKENLYTDTMQCWDLFFKICQDFGLPKFNLHAHPHEDDYETIEAIMKDSEILKSFEKSSSCYAQINFRERQNKALQRKFKTIKLYKGCGNCVKCVRINSGLLKRAIEKKSISKNEARYLFTHIKKKFRERHGKDKTIEKYISSISPQIEKYMSLRLI